MESAALAPLALAVATVSGLVLAFLLAVAALVFDRTVGQAAATQAAGNDAVAAVYSAYMSLQSGDRREYWVSQVGYTRDEWPKLLRLVSDTDYHPRGFDAASYQRQFREDSLALARHNDANVESFGLVLPAMRPDQAAAFAPLTERVESFIMVQTFLFAHFEQTVRLYADTLDVWRQVRDELRWTWMAIA